MKYKLLLLFIVPFCLHAELKVIYSDLRQQTESDTGTIRLLLHNFGKTAEKVTLVKAGDIVLPVYNVVAQKHDPVMLKKLSRFDRAKLTMGHTMIYWAKLDKNPIKPGEQVWLRIKRKNKSNTSTKISVFLNGKENPLVQTIDLSKVPLKISAVRYKKKSSELLIFIENSTAKEETVKALFINSEREKNIKSEVLGANMKTCLVFKSIKKRKHGDRMTFYLTTKSGKTAADLTTLVLGFPINVEFGKAPEGYGFDPEPYAWKLEDKDGKIREAELVKGVATKSIQAHDCPAHSLDRSFQKNAYFNFDLETKLLAMSIQQPYSSHICRTNIAETIVALSETVPIIRFNPNIKENDIRLNPIKITRHAVQNAAPNTVHAVFALQLIDGKRYVTRDELRNLVYTALANGSRGIFFRYSSDAISKDLKQGLKELIEELTALKPYLEFMDIDPVIQYKEKDLKIFQLTGYKLKMIIAVNYGKEKSHKLEKENAYVYKRFSAGKFHDVEQAFVLKTGINIILRETK
ncbi:MAG: hypothetical protein HRT89_04420 [Lentisphaeria bacterium]|nr:hypothetical protein [Lentisphaeria bacterium]